MGEGILCFFHVKEKKISLSKLPCIDKHLMSIVNT